MLADLIGQPQFKIPLHGFTDQRRLVAHLLAVANRRITAAEVGMFAYRRAAAKKQHGLANAACGVINLANSNIPVLIFGGRTPISEHSHFGCRNTPIGYGQEILLFARLMTPQAALASPTLV